MGPRERPHRHAEPRVGSSGRAVVILPATAVPETGRRFFDRLGQTAPTAEQHLDRAGLHVLEFSRGLTAQETACLRWCKEGKTNWEIGSILDISAKTVEFHLANVMRKLGAANRITAVVTGIKRGIIPL